ncbi:MAG: transporter substrate-binding domain-containing protein [Clostridia bacterium]|nr:transporter substrate-binding domain-containing protein [Clostridia bacterium]
MKKLFASVASALLLVTGALGLTACGKEEVKYPVEDGKFTVVTNCPFGMYEYIGNDGKIYGIDIELAGLFAQENNLELVVKNIDFDAIFTQVESGYADAGMAGITVTADRQKVYDFSDTYCKASQKLIVLDTNNDFEGMTDAVTVENALKGLSGKKIGYQTGTTGGMYINGDEDFGFDGFANIEGKGYDTAVLAVEDMINGNLYAVVVDEGPANAIAKEKSGVKVIDVKLTDEEYAFVMKKGNKTLQDKFNEFIAKVKADGTYDAIEAKYYQNVGTKVGYKVTTD